MSTPDKVLVVGCRVNGLGAIRALGNKNIHIVAMSYEKIDFAYVSKYVSEVVSVPHPRHEENAFISFLVTNADRWKGAMILETDDNSAVTISKHKAELQKYYKVATPEWEQLRKFIEKKEAFLIARASGVPHPTTFLPTRLEDMDDIKDNISYPCILKPVRGHEFFSIFNIKNFMVHNSDELVESFKKCLEHDQEVMVQEIIVGPDTNLYKLQAYINSKGEMKAKFFWNKLRQHPPAFGVGRVGISTERNEQVERQAEQLMKQANYKGYFSVEFKKDPKDNQLKLMEVNVRMPRNNMLATGSGVNFPWIIYMDMMKDEQVEVKEYTVGFYWIELYIDIFNSIFQHNKENFTIREYLAPYLSRKKVFAVFSVHDMKPFLYQTVITFQRAILKISRLLHLSA